MTTSRNTSAAQKILTAVEKSAIVVELVVVKSKTEYMVFNEVTADAGIIPEPVTLSVHGSGSDRDSRLLQMPLVAG